MFPLFCFGCRLPPMWGMAMVYVCMYDAKKLCLPWGQQRGFHTKGRKCNYCCLLKMKRFDAVLMNDDNGGGS